MHRAFVFAVRLFFTVTLVSVAAVSSRAQSTVNVTVDANMDIYQAGGNVDGSDGIAPVIYTFPAKASQTMSSRLLAGLGRVSEGLQNLTPMAKRPVIV